MDELDLIDLPKRNMDDAVDPFEKMSKRHKSKGLHGSLNVLLLLIHDPHVIGLATFLIQQVEKQRLN